MVQFKQLQTLLINFGFQVIYGVEKKAIPVTIIKPRAAVIGLLIIQSFDIFLVFIAVGFGTIFE